MRIIALVPSYTVINILCISFPNAAVYLTPLLEILQALCLASYFVLLCEYISPHTQGRDAFFARIEIEDKEAPDGKVNDNVKWFKVSLFFFQKNKTKKRKHILFV